MDDAKVDRLARALAGPISRRQMVVLLSAAISMLGQQAARGAQLGPAACGELGAVCILGSGCCDGLTCVTSAINTSYGICVLGDGGMVSIGTTLVFPFSETAVEEMSALLQTASTTPVTDPEAERQTRLAEIRARRETSRTERMTRLDTRRAAVQARKDEQRNRQRQAKDVAPGPQLHLKLLFSNVGGDSEVVGDQLVPIEEVQVTNRDDVNVVLTRIETIKGVVHKADLTTSQFTLRPGKSYSFFSGFPTEDGPDAAKREYRWLDKVACGEDIQQQGYRVNAGLSGNAKIHQFVVLCDRPHTSGVVEPPAAAPPHKGDSQHQKEKNR